MEPSPKLEQAPEAKGVPVNAEGWTCNLCERIFRNDRYMLIECEYCSKHFCIKCLNYKTHEYQSGHDESRVHVVLLGL